MASLSVVKLAPRRCGQHVHEGPAGYQDLPQERALDKEVGLRTGTPLSHVFEVKGIEQLLFLTDVAFMPPPDAGG